MYPPETINQLARLHIEDLHEQARIAHLVAEARGPRRWRPTWPRLRSLAVRRLSDLRS